MKKVILSKKDLNNIISSKSINDKRTTYDVDGELYKLSKNFLEDINSKTFDYSLRKYDISESQIEWLSSLSDKVKSSRLPNGIIEYKNTPVGVIYPYVFRGYLDFNSLSGESSGLILSNMRSATNKNIELLINNIYNTDLLNQNILYKDTDVQLIDLDGKYIKTDENCNLSSVYNNYYLCDLFKIIMNKLEKDYDVEEYKRLRSEILNIFTSGESLAESIDYPLQVIDKVERLRVLK